MSAKRCRYAGGYVLLLSFLWTMSSFLGANGDYLEEGDECGDQQWKCRRLSECLTGQNDLKVGKHPEICSFLGVLPVICCRPDSDSRWPPTTKRPQVDYEEPTRSPSVKDSVSRRMCVTYAQYVYRKEQAPILSFDTPEVTVNECGRIEEPLIVGGKDAKPKEFPHMAQIGYGEKARISWLCGGSLISERFVMSAAHCTHPNGKGPAKWARLGDLDTISNNDGPPPETMRITERLNHPGYNKVELYNDIALYKLERDVTFTPYIRPICLQVEHSIPQKVMIATGWGHTQWSGRPSTILQKVSLDLVSARTCNDSYRENIGRQLPSGILDSKMVCAGMEEGKDTCQGDSGGPLQIPLRTPYCMYAQVGVTSFGRGCAENNPGVYTRVSYYVPWIESIVWPGQ